MPYINSSGGGLGGVGVTGTAASGDVPVASSAAAAAWAFPPGHEFGYDQITTGVNIVGTTEAAPTTIITCAAHVFDGAPVLCEFYSAQVSFPTAATNNTLGISLWEGSTELGLLSFIRVAEITSQWFTSISTQFRFTPSAASHTYLLTAFASSVTGTPNVGASTGGVGQPVPAFVRFTKA